MASADALSLAFVEEHPTDAARVLEELAPEASAALFARAPARVLAPALRAMLPVLAARALAHVPAADAARLLAAAGPGTVAAILRHTDRARRAGLLDALPTPAAVATQLLLGHPETAVGAWLDVHVATVPADALAAAALERLRTGPGDGVLAVVDGTQRLVGLLDATTLLRAAPTVPVAQLMAPPRWTLPARALLASVERHPGWDEHPALPVVEADGRLVGTLRRGALVRALAHLRGEDRRHAPSAAGGVAETYWRAFAALVAALVALLPAPAAVGGPRRDG